MKKTFAVLASITAIVSSFMITQTTYALIGGNQPVQTGVETARSAEQPTSLFGATGTISTVTNVLLYVIGALAVIMIVFGGLRYVISGGNATQITAAKNTILYAVIGLVVAIMAYAIINFVIGAFTGGGGSGGTNV